MYQVSAYFVGSMVRSAYKVLFNPNTHDVLVALFLKDIRYSKLLKKAK